MRRARASFCVIRRLRWIIHSGESFHSSGEALSVLIDELACHRLAAPRGVDVTLGCYDDRALHEDVPRAREGIGVAQAGFLGEATHDRADLLEMPNAGTARWMLRAEFEQYLHERARLEVVAMEPLVEYIEDGE